MSAVIKVDSLQIYSSHSYSKEPQSTLVIVPLVKEVQYVGKEWSWYVGEDSYYEIINDEKKYFVFIVKIDGTQYTFKQESQALEFYELVQKELEDFYQHYTNYVTSM